MMNFVLNFNEKICEIFEDMSESEDEFQQLLKDDAFAEEDSEGPGALQADSEYESSSDEDEAEEESDDTVIMLDGDEADLIDSWHDLLDIRNFEEKSSPDPSGNEEAEAPENDDSESDEAPLERIQPAPKVGSVQGSRPDLNYPWRPDYEPYYDGNPQGICGRQIFLKNVEFLYL